MPYTLILVESPAKCKTIMQYLGPAYRCLATWGHIRELAAVDPVNFHATYRLLQTKRAQIKLIKTCALAAQEVILATDADREGEGIAWHLCRVLKLDLAATKRMRFNELTASALAVALAACATQRVNMGLVAAQQARQIVDYLVGFTMSPRLQTRFAINNLAAGRCLIPALLLLRDASASASKPPVYQVTGYFTSMNLPFQLTLPSEEAAQALIAASRTHTHIFNRGALRDTVTPQATPWNTCQLLQASPFLPTETMTLCQRLYEAGHITYMRTDGQTYSKEFYQVLNAPMHAQTNAPLQAPLHAPLQAHEAIRPTNFALLALPDEFSLSEKRMYKIIREHVRQSGLPANTGKAFTAFISAPLAPAAPAPAAPAPAPLAPAPAALEYQLTVTHGSGLGLPDERGYAFLQQIKAGTAVQLNKITVTAQTAPSKKLLHSLEQYGIGRPSTYATIMERLVELEYATWAFGDLLITPRGEQIAEYLALEPVFQYAYTRELELSLDKIGQQDDTLLNVCHRLNDQLGPGPALGVLAPSVDALTKKKPNTVLREITAGATIRTGPYGDFIFYQPGKGRKPLFLKLTNCPDYKTCDQSTLVDWFYTQYKLTKK